MSEIEALWCGKIVDALIRGGVRTFCLSPGSRVTPLVLAIAARKEAEIFVHFDERGMAFHALGRAKATQSPVALLVTSGTAVGNLLPAVMEAFHSEVPLILLTADRPPELQSSCASQTTDQIKFFGSFVTYACDLPAPTSAVTENFLASTISLALMRSSNGPVHLNCQFREPFSRATLDFAREMMRRTYLPNLAPSEEALQMVSEAIGEAIGEAKCGMIRISGGIDSSAYPAIIALAERCGYPIFADIQSGLRDLSLTKNLIAHSALLKEAELKPDLLLHFGTPMLPKTEPYRCRQIQISASAKRQDPSHLISEQIVCDPKLFCEKVVISKRADPSWLVEWQSLGSAARESVKELNGLSDIATLNRILQAIDAENLFLGNSLPIHNADLIYYKEGKMPHLFSNRGLAGIDGNIATACGICAATGKSTVAIIGDLTALHDLNSLAQISALKAPLTCIILNNSGGGIFSQLPVKNQTDQFEKLFATEHTYTFKMAAAQFNLPYHTSLTKEALISGGIIEIATAREENESVRSQLFAKAKEFSCTTP